MANGFLDLVGTPMLLSTGTAGLTVGTNGSGDLRLMANGSVAVTVPGAGGAVVFANALRTKQAVNNVNDTTPTAAELTTSFGDPATLGRGFIGTVDDADGDTNGYIVWCSDAAFYFLKGTKAS
jgi:hypothetical protein